MTSATSTNAARPDAPHPAGHRTTSPVNTTTTELASHVTSTVTALRDAESTLPLDGSLPTPDQRDANVVRRTSLNAVASRLRVDFQQLSDAEHRAAMLAPWLTTLRDCQKELECRLAEAEDAGATDTRAFRLTERLRHSLRDVLNGPELVSGSEFTTDILTTWLTDHHVTPLPGETGIFAGRGGLRSAELRLANLELEITQARTQLERTLNNAQQLL